MIKRMISLIGASLLIVSLLAGCGNEKGAVSAVG